MRLRSRVSPGQAGEAVFLGGIRPSEEMATTHRVAGTLKTDAAWTLKVQVTFDGGATWVDSGAGTAVLANALLDFNVYVAGGGRRRLVAVFGGGVTPTTWLNSGQVRMIEQADFVA